MTVGYRGFGVTRSFELPEGDDAPVAPAGRMRFRFNRALARPEVSVDQGSWQAIAVGAGDDVWTQTGEGLAGTVEPSDAALGDLLLVANRVEINDLTGGTPYLDTDEATQALFVRAPGQLRLASSGGWDASVLRWVASGGTLQWTTSTWPAFNRVRVTSSGSGPGVLEPFEAATPATLGWFTRVHNDPTSLESLEIHDDGGATLVTLAPDEAAWIVSSSSAWNYFK